METSTRPPARFRPPWLKREAEKSDSAVSFPVPSTSSGLKRIPTDTAPQESNKIIPPAECSESASCTEEAAEQPLKRPLETSLVFNPPQLLHQQQCPAPPKRPCCAPLLPTPSQQPQAAFSAYKVMYCKRSLKKHKTYFDGILLPKAYHSVILSEWGATVTKAHLRVAGKPPYKDSDTFTIGGFEGEIGQAIPQADFISGRCFTNNASVDLVAAAPVQLLLQPPAALRRQQPAPRKAAACAKEAEDSDGTREKDLFLEEALQEDKGASLTPAAAAAAAPDGASAAATAGGRPLPLLGDYLSVHLRPHQREGLEWMYSRVSEGGGCILADSMGLGKTLQALALLCSLLGLHASQQQNSAAFKALIVCPTSLKGSWKKEFKKWLGNRIVPLVSCGDTRQVSDSVQAFVCSKRNQVLISSYEDIRRVAVPCSVDLLVCDEGHRLRSLRSQTSVRLQSINSKRKLLLSGTPLQNNLEELYSCCHFVCPGVLPNEKTFKKVFLEPILRGCRPDATESEMNIARERETELMNQMSSFMLRRTSKVLENLLPRKRVLTVHVELSTNHKLAYNEFCNKCVANLHAAKANCLGLLTTLRRIVNVPDAICTKPQNFEEDASKTFAAEEENNEEGYLNEGCREETEEVLNPNSTVLADPSNKMVLLLHIISQLSSDPIEKAVIVSNSTVVLNRVEALLKVHAVESLRLDGHTPESTRGDLVEKFNNDKHTKAFLLSSKAGGTGLNLTGANRLIHFDPDWNPANDQQALSRIWRDGQTKPVFIYRFVGAGTLEAQIIRRQLFKNSLAKTFVDGREGSSGRWIAERIKDLLKPISGVEQTVQEEEAGNIPLNVFYPGSSSNPPPSWLEGFHLNLDASLLRQVELEEDTLQVLTETEASSS